MSATRHSSDAHAQRGANGQPRPTATRSGGDPGMGTSGRLRSRLGIDAMRPIV